jgi:hypothetical protein
VSGLQGSILVLDRDVQTQGDPRLIAHLAADEPSGNAALVGRHYLDDAGRRRCRRATRADLLAPNPMPDPAVEVPIELPSAAAPLLDGRGRAYHLGRDAGRLNIPELRWLRRADGSEPRPASVREVIGSLESYEPVRAHTALALHRHREDPSVSVAALRAELERIDASRIVLNRGLRQAVLDAAHTSGLSMSEIAIRCGRVKRDARGNTSGETSWLARRIGLAPEGGASEPTPWVHSEVLALIARVGLGISPREVELG